MSERDAACERVFEGRAPSAVHLPLAYGPTLHSGGGPCEAGCSCADTDAGHGGLLEVGVGKASTRLWGALYKWFFPDRGGIGVLGLGCVAFTSLRRILRMLMFLGF